MPSAFTNRQTLPSAFMNRQTLPSAFMNRQGSGWILGDSCTHIGWTWRSAHTLDVPGDSCTRGREWERATVHRDHESPDSAGPRWPAVRAGLRAACGLAKVSTGGAPRR